MAFDKATAERIERIIDDCEYVQESRESDYAKEQAKISAYEQIKAEVGYKKHEDI